MGNIYTLPTRRTTAANRAAVPIDHLCDFEQWVAWEHQERKGKPTKVPVRSRKGWLASSTDPNSWMMLSQAERIVESRKQCEGVGIVLGTLMDGPDNPYRSKDFEGGLRLGGIDLDSCYDPETEEITDPWCRKVVNRFRTYGEISPSGRGLKLIFLYAAGDSDLLGDKSGKSFSRGQHQEMALWLAERFFTITWDSFDVDEPLPVSVIDRDTLEWFLKVAGPAYLDDGGPDKPRGAKNKKLDGSRSGVAFRMAQRIKLDGGKYDDFKTALQENDELSAWARDERQVRRAWERSADGVEADGLMRSASGEPHSNLANALTLLRSHKSFAGRLSHDDMANSVLLDGKPTNDRDVTGITESLQRLGLKKLAEGQTYSAVNAVASEHGFHPVRDKLNKLEHDGRDRLDSWLHVYLGADDNDYTSAVGRFFLISMVARVMRPGCKVDYMPILEGDQGAAKSTVCSILAGDAYFSDHLPDVGSKDAAIHMLGKWLIEVAELEKMRKAEVTEMKAFVTRRVDKYRPPYGRNEIEAPRQNVFIGTTNNDTYLRDATGNRRFWPVKTGRIDLDALWRDRDQLFAEAVVAFKAGEPWWPDRDFEARHIAPEQQSRFESDPWEERIVSYLREEDRVTVAELMESVLALEVSQQTQQAKLRVTSILKHLGWSQHRTGSKRYYVRVAVAQKVRGKR